MCNASFFDPADTSFLHVLNLFHFPSISGSLLNSFLTRSKKFAKPVFRCCPVSILPKFFLSFHLFDFIFHCPFLLTFLHFFSSYFSSSFFSSSSPSCLIFLPHSLSSETRVINGQTDRDGETWLKDRQVYRQTDININQPSLHQTARQIFSQERQSC